MNRYRKKPVVIEARQFDGSPITAKDIVEWVGEGGANWTAEKGWKAIYIQTLEGEMRADIGDWIIRGVNGEFYPCKPDIFTATYEPTEEPTT